MTERQAPVAAIRLLSLAFAALCTLAILIGVDHLATSEAGAPQLAQSSSASHG